MKNRLTQPQTWLIDFSICLWFGFQTNLSFRFGYGLNFSLIEKLVNRNTG